MSLSPLLDISYPTNFLRLALSMLTEYEQAKEDNDRPQKGWFPTLSFCLAPDGYLRHLCYSIGSPEMVA